MKPGTAKVKGRETENFAVAWLRTHGFPTAERRRLNGSTDLGDVINITNWTIEVKSAATWSPMLWQRQLRAEMINTGDRYGLIMCRPKGIGADVDNWIFIIPPEVFADIHTQLEGPHP